MNLAERWDEMKVRLELQLKANSLDHEKKPFSTLTGKGIGPDGKTSDGQPTRVLWQSGPTGEEESEMVKQNSDHLLAALKLWGLELPNM